MNIDMMAIEQLWQPNLNNLLQVQMTCYWFTISSNKGNKQVENRTVHTNSMMYSLEQDVHVVVQCKRSCILMYVAAHEQIK